MPSVFDLLDVMPRTLHDWLHEFSPIVATTTVISTLVTCVIITKARHVYTGGLHWPYFSDMGRDSPAYYVFCIGLLIVAVTLASTWIFNAEFQREVLRPSIRANATSESVQIFSTLATSLAVISVIGLPVLSICDTSSFPEVHNIAAYSFFLLQTLAVTINTVVTNRIYAATKRIQTNGTILSVGTGSSPHLMSVRRTFHLQLLTYMLFLIAFLIYLPIGLSIIKSFKHLTIDECIARNLGHKYCVEDMNYDTTETRLWNYENDFAANQLRAGAQLVCILTLIGYTMTFKTHDDTSITKTLPDT